MIETDKEKLRKQTIKNTRSVLLPNREGLLSDAFEKEFRGFFGFPFPYERLGYTSTMELIETMPDVVCIEPLPSGHILLTGIPDKDTEHVSRMVKNQRQNQEGYNRRTAQVIQQQGSSFRRMIERSKVTEAARKVPKHTQAVVADMMLEHEDGLAMADFCRAFHEKIGYRLEFQSLGFLNLQDFVYYGLGDTVHLTLVDGHFGLEWVVFPRRHAVKTQPEQCNEVKVDFSAVEKTSDCQSKSRILISDLVSDQMKTEFKAIASLYSDGLTGNQLSQDYQKLYGSKLMPQEFGCDSVTEMCLWLPEIFEVVHDGDDWRFKARQNVPNESEKKLVHYDQQITQSDSADSQIKSLSKYISSNVQRIMMRHPLGLPCQKFRRAYLDIIGNNLDVRNIGFNNLESFLNNPDIKHYCHLTNETGSIMVRPSLEIIKNITDNRQDVLGWNSELIEQGLPTDRKTGDFVEVIVTEVFNPYRFWIRLNGNASKSLEALMDDMEIFYYGEKSKQYKVPDELVVVGMLCASLYSDGIWHRACIKSITDVSNVEVFYVDYGIAAKVRIDTLRYLHKKFGTLPGQAIEARLAGIKPMGGLGRFPKEVSYRFLELVKSSPDGGRVVAAIRGLKPRLMLSLMGSCNVQGGISINRVLVDEGLAELDGPMEREQQALTEICRSPLRRSLFGLITPTESSSKNVPIDTKFKMESLASWVTSSNDPEWIKNPKTIQHSEPDHINNLLKEINQEKDDMATTNFALPTAEIHLSRKSTSKYVRPMDLSGHTGHVVNLYDNAWMTSKQISRLIPNWKGRDLLTRMLKLKRMSVDSARVTFLNHPMLFSELIDLGAGITEKEIWLYPLKSVPHILNMFQQIPETNLREALIKEIRKFDPKDWAFL